MSTTNENEDTIQINLSNTKVDEDFDRQTYEEHKRNEEEVSHTESTTVDDASKGEEIHEEVEETHEEAEELSQDSGINLEIQHDQEEVIKILLISKKFFFYISLFFFPLGII